MLDGLNLTALQLQLNQTLQSARQGELTAMGAVGSVIAGTGVVMLYAFGHCLKKRKPSPNQFSPYAAPKTPMATHTASPTPASVSSEDDSPRTHLVGASSSQPIEDGDHEAFTPSTASPPRRFSPVGPYRRA